ncbi:C-type lectin domain family 17, member A-like [Portunus trituberculatus]|uniref:C-type lectin domain family 17, member A-like n=1 Tax=Portunus trituberculatus TaxID=210409 RepID=UPI001E1CF8B4|nr:C-type lectin domain family 17, member A-like [Portunus trituberculatus]
MMSLVAKCVVACLQLLVWAFAGTAAYPATPHGTPDDLRSGIAMAQMILAQQAQLFRELINATKESHSCCSAGKSDLPESISDCPYPFKQVLDECYYLSSNTLTWHNARHSCQGMGGELAMPIYLYALRNFVAGERGPPRSVWVGANNHNGGWRWLNGLPVDDAEWGKKQPNNRRPTDQCLAVRRDRHPVLDDMGCGSNLRFVCQYHPVKK